MLITKCTNVACTASTTTAVGAIGLGQQVSMTIAPDGNPIIAASSSNGKVQLTKCNDPACIGANESVNEFGPTTGFLPSVSLALGIDGNAVIAFIDGTNKVLKVARCNDSVCAGDNETITTLDTFAVTSQATRVIIGGDGNPIVAWIDQDATDLLVTYCNDPACSGGDEQIIIGDTLVENQQFGLSMTLDATGQLLIPHRESGINRLRITNIYRRGLTRNSWDH